MNTLKGIFSVGVERAIRPLHAKNRPGLFWRWQTLANEHI